MPQKNSSGKERKMVRRKSEEIVLEGIKQLVISNEQDMRIIDAYRHFLGKILKGRIYVYCRRCKKFVLVHNHGQID